MKYVVNHNAANNTTKSNVLTPDVFLYAGIVTCGIACTGVCCVVGIVNTGACIGVADVVGIGGIHGISAFCSTGCVVTGASATTSPSLPLLTERSSVWVGPSIASRSKVFGVSTGAACGITVASGDNPPALACHSNSSMIFISSFNVVGSIIGS